MTREAKEILLKDLCARLPYGVKVQSTFYNCDGTIWKYENEILTAELLGYPITRYKPYLFPLSSMTEEQKKEYNLLRNFVPIYYYGFDIMVDKELYDNWESIDYLNAHHFDYRGLIENGLAIDATNLNIY